MEPCTAGEVKMETRNGLGFRIEFGKYLQELLTAVASIFPAFFLQFVGWTFHHGWSASSQTGLTAVAGGLLESVLSGWFLGSVCSLFFLALRRQTREQKEREGDLVLGARGCGLCFWDRVLAWSPRSASACSGTVNPIQPDTPSFRQPRSRSPFP
jgi:hypothetical protein